MSKVKIQTGLRLEEGVYLKLKSLAEAEGRSINNMAEVIIKQYLDGYEKKFGPIPLDDPEAD